MLKVLSSILCDLDPKVKVIGQKAGICDGVPSTSALVFPSFVKNLLIFLVFHKFGTFLDKCFEILFQNKILRVLN